MADDGVDGSDGGGRAGLEVNGLRDINVTGAGDEDLNSGPLHKEREEDDPKGDLLQEGAIGEIQRQ